MEDRDDYPAFPVTAGNQVYATGMTLRDYLAGQVLSGKLASGRILPSDPDHAKVTIAEFLASESYLMADAMLEARKK